MSLRDLLPKRKKSKASWRVRATEADASIDQTISANNLEGALAEFRKSFPTAEISEISRREVYYW